jgi:hypothetical protein
MRKRAGWSTRVFDSKCANLDEVALG